MHFGEVSGGGKDLLLPVHILVFRFFFLVEFSPRFSCSEDCFPPPTCIHIGIHLYLVASALLAGVSILLRKWHFPQVGQDGGGILLAL